MKRILYLLAALLLPTLSQAQASVYNVKQYGATGKKSDYATTAIQAAIDAAAKAGGGTVYFPAGDYLSAQINLKDNITLWIDNGAKIWASNKDEDYTEKFYCEDTAEGGIPMVIYGNKVRNIRITGGGAIEGQPEYFQKPYRYNEWTKEDCDAALEAGLPLVCTRWKNRISNIYLYDCQDVRIDNISLLNSSAWPCHLRFCERIYLEGIYVYSKLETAANTDGFDIDGCKDIVINNCIMEVGDDGICFKSTKWKDGFRNCENAVVSNCIVQSSSTALKIGSESHGVIRNIKFNNCIVRNTNRAITIFCRDGNLVSDITYSNIEVECRRYSVSWWGSAELFRLLTSKRRADTPCGTIRNVTMKDIHAKVEGSSWIRGFEGMQNIENIRIENVAMEIWPESAIDKRAREGISIENAKNVEIDNLKIEWIGEKQPKWTHSLILNNIDNLWVNRLKITNQPAGFAPIVTSNVTDSNIGEYMDKR